MRVLVTAFKPFNKASVNYSSEVLQLLHNVDKAIVDVVYDYCYSELANKFNLDEYDLIIALGEARSRKELTLEIIAKNISSCSLKDNQGQLKKDEIINTSLGEYLQTKVNIDKIKDEVTLSYDAGKYVCNNLYFHLLENYQDKSLFIHIPECSNDELEYLKHANTINKIISILES